MYKMKTYKSGLRLVCEEMPDFTSVTFCTLINTGAIDEKEEELGISHLIEHMLFKGTEKRNALEIAESFKNIGALSNAYTSREETVFYAKAISKYAENVVEIISDMIQNSVIDEKELKREKNVVCEEIKMYLDEPENVCANLVDSAFYKGSLNARDVIGTSKTVRAITREQILDYMKQNYIAKNMVISFAGKITFEEAQALVEKYYAKYLEGENESKVRKYVEDVFPESPISRAKFKDNNQTVVCISYPLPNRYKNKDGECAILNNIWGSGSNMSNRLFQKIREKMGLVYRISSSMSMTSFGGDITIEFATSTKNVPLALKAINGEIKKLIKHKITEKEFESAKVCCSTSLLMRYESTHFIALSNARDLSIFGEIQTKENLIDKLNNVKIEDVNELIDFVYNNDNYVLASVGKEYKYDLIKMFTGK